MKAGLATPEQLRKAKAERRQEQRRESKGKRDAKDGSRTPGLRPPKQGRPAPGSRGAPARETGRREDGAYPAGQKAGERAPGGGAPRTRSGDGPAAGARRRPAKAPPPGQEPSVHALNLRIRDLLDRHALNDRNAELAFSFMRENTVRRVYVTEEQRRKLTVGELAIVGFRRRHHIVPAGVADEIRTLRPIVFVHRADALDTALVSDAAAEDDPYRAFPVPDDLHW